MLALLTLLLALEDIPPLEISLPIDGLPPSALHDSFKDSRAGHRAHEAIDIMSPYGTPIRAVAPGTIRKLTRSALGGISIYQFDETGSHCFFYAHLQRYAKGLHEGMQIERGDIIGYVGATGNAKKTSPHLHFTLFEVGPEKKWWTGRMINPYDALVAAAAAKASKELPTAIR